MKREAVIIGYSGHAYVVLDILKANKYSVISYCEQAAKKHNPFNLKYIGDEKNDDSITLLQNKDVFLGIGDSSTRSRVYLFLKSRTILMPFIKHPTAVVSPTALISEGSVIMQGAIVNAFSKIGNAVICNTASVIEHECILADFVHIAPGAVLAGNVSVGKFTFVGANAVVKQGIQIGNNVIVGAGTVVVNDIPDNTVVYGNPAKAKLS